MTKYSNGLLVIKLHARINSRWPKISDLGLIQTSKLSNKIYAPNADIFYYN